MILMQVRVAEAELRHKLFKFPPNAWMKVLHFNVKTSCLKDELHQWFSGLHGEHIIPAIVTKEGLRRGSHIYKINAWLWNFGRPQP